MIHTVLEKREKVTVCTFPNFFPFFAKSLSALKQEPFSPVVNFINILQTIFFPISFCQKIQSQNELEKSWAKHFWMKNVCVKCWWNWLLIEEKKQNLLHREIELWTEKREWKPRHSLLIGAFTTAIYVRIYCNEILEILACVATSKVSFSRL